MVHGDTGAIACDHYHRAEADLDLLAGLGLDRLPVLHFLAADHPRTAPGRCARKGLDFYRRLVDGLLTRGVRPMATLYHWDLPQPLQDTGGWANRDTVAHFCDYAQVVLDALGDAVPHWATVNEPFCGAMIGHLQGRHAPGQVDLAAALAAAHHLLLAHGQAVGLARRLAPQAQVGIAHLLSDISPASDSSADADAARRLDGYENRWFSTRCCAAVTPPTCSTGTGGRCRWTSSVTATCR